MMKLKKDYEDEVKIFNVDPVAVKEALIEAGYTSEIKITTIDFFKSFNGVKFKMILRDKCVEIVRKTPAKKNKNARIENKKKFPTEILDASVYGEMREMFIKIMQLPLLFHGIKRREIFHLDKDTNIAIDLWIDGDLKGVGYLEVECTDRNKSVNHLKLLKPFLPKGAEPRVTRKGTLGVYADFVKVKRKVASLDKLYKKA